MVKVALQQELLVMTLVPRPQLAQLHHRPRALMQSSGISEGSNVGTVFRSVQYPIPKGLQSAYTADFNDKHWGGCVATLLFLQ